MKVPVSNEMQRHRAAQAGAGRALSAALRVGRYFDAV